MLALLFLAPASAVAQASVPDTAAQRAEAARAIDRAQATLDSARRSGDAPAELVRWSMLALNSARRAYRAGNYDAVFDSAAVAATRADRAMYGPKSDVFDRTPAPAGAPSLRDSVPYGATGPGAGEPYVRTPLPPGTTSPGPGAPSLPDSVPANTERAAPTPAVHP